MGALLPFVFAGASDDLVEIGGRLNDEAQHYGPEAWIGTIRTPDGDGLRVVVNYETEGVWSAGVAQLDEGVRLPDWRLEIRNSSECDYSVELWVHAPADAELSWPGQDDES